MNRKSIIFNLLFIIVLTLSVIQNQAVIFDSSSICHSTGSVFNLQSDSSLLNDYKVIMFIANGVGNGYYIIKDQLEFWGCNVTIAGLSEVIQSCSNRGESKSITSDVVISTIDNEEILEYDCIFIPSGGHWGTLVIQNNVLDLISTAYDQGKLVSSFCVGTAVLAAANVINKTKVASHENANALILQAGGIIVPPGDARVVSDNRVITGGRGGGLQGGGYLTAPNYELCVALARELLGYSYSLSTTITSKESDSETNITIEVETTNLPKLSLNTTNISRVTAYIYLQEEESSLVKTVNLLDKNGDNIYSSVITGLQNGDYSVDILVKDTGEGLEIKRNVVEFSIGAKFVSGYGFFVLIFSITLISGKARRHRKKRKNLK